MFSTILMLVFGSTVGILWSLFVFPFVLLNVKCYKLNGHRLDTFSKHIKYASVWSDNCPENWIIGKWYIGYLICDDNEKSTRTLYLFIRTKDYISLTTNSCSSKIEKTQEQLYYGEREGTYWNFKYVTRQINVTSHNPRQIQLNVVDKINQFYQQNNYCVALITGRPNKGKSMIAHFLGKHFVVQQNKKVTIIDSFDPTDAGDNFSRLYHKQDPNENHILIIVLEEIDVTINKIHNNTVVHHKNIPTEITSKVTWNKFLDRFDHKMYQHIILLMTSNLTISELDSLDSSYFRDNRVNLKFAI